MTHYITLLFLLICLTSEGQSKKEVEAAYDRILTQQTWVMMTGNGVDTSFISVKNSTKFMNLKKETIIKTWIKYHVIDEDEKEVISIIEFNCSTSKMKFNYAYIYNTSGKLLREGIVQANKWDEIIPGSNAELWKATACAFANRLKSNK